MKPYLIIKRKLDFIFTLILLIIASPIMLIAAIAIKMESPKGPILFKQARPGKDGKIFKAYKFRTMEVETECDGKLLSNEDRITKVGSLLRKTSIDELPQLINILRGEMSFIGPRPLLVKYLPYYTEEEMKRHSVLPGITGWAQVNGRNTVDWEKRFSLDLEYVEKVSFLFDLKITLLTIYKVFKRTDIVVDGMPDLDVERREKSNVEEMAHEG